MAKQSDRGVFNVVVYGWDGSKLFVRTYTSLSAARRACYRWMDRAETATVYLD